MGKDFLSEIIRCKKQEAKEAEKSVPISVLREKAQKMAKRRPFIERLKNPGRSGANIIAEIKRASPSKGNIRIDLDPAEQARAYEEGGAAAISVLTESRFFKGSVSDLQAARQATSLPVLRKDFLISEYQIYESAAMGADALLLIVRCLTPTQLKDYLSLCQSLGLDALVEVHSDQDLEVAKEVGATLIGVNNRNLQSFKTDLNIAIRMASAMFDYQIPVAASGINCRADIEKNLDAGIFNFLIGESLVRAPDPRRFLRDLSGQTVQVKICGLTRVEEALGCARLGADAIGLVFFPKSPRYVTDDRAKAICDALDDSVQKIGVFVDEPLELILRKVEHCGLTGVQLHGEESPEMVEALASRGVTVIKGLFMEKKPSILDAAGYRANAYLVECGKGKLPGGNARTWKWSEAEPFGEKYPMILAGGLDPDNVVEAIFRARPHAVDVSSGVEASPGRKDLEKVKNFIRAVRLHARGDGKKLPEGARIF